MPSDRDMETALLSEFSIPRGLALIVGTLAAIAVVTSQATAQTSQAERQATKQVASGGGAPATATPDEDARPLATGRSTPRVPSTNEIYNDQRAADGRLGIRLGNDMGARVSTSPAPPPRR